MLDLLYRTEESNHHYVFTAEYTIGVIGPKTRIRRAASFSEAKAAAVGPVVIRMGSHDISLSEQYEALLKS